jgi:hypothetical protein
MGLRAQVCKWGPGHLSSAYAGPVIGKRRMAAIVGVVVVIAALVGATSWRHDLDRQKYPVAMPPAHASARQVVLAYLHALDAHDAATADGLSTFAFRSETRSWLQSTAGMQNITVDGVTHYAGQAEYDVTVSFRYASHWWKHDDSFPDGQKDWGYILVARHGRLLISDDGTG